MISVLRFSQRSSCSAADASVLKIACLSSSRVARKLRIGFSSCEDMLIVKARMFATYTSRGLSINDVQNPPNKSECVVIDKKN